jgi:hypothetical protein
MSKTLFFVFGVTPNFLFQSLLFFLCMTPRIFE